MPTYEYHCPGCGRTEDRYIRLVDFDQQAGCQRCSRCEALMQRQSFTVSTCPTFIGRKKPMNKRRPRIRGFESGPTGFLKNSTERDGCCDPSQRARLRRNAAEAGVNIAGGVFVPGLCRDGRMDDEYAVCRDMSEVAAKAEEQGVALNGPDIDFCPPIRDEQYRDHEESHRNYRPAPSVVLPDVRKEIEETGVTPTPSVVRSLTEKYQEKHGQSPIVAKGPSLERLLDAPVSALKEVP